MIDVNVKPVYVYKVRGGVYVLGGGEVRAKEVLRRGGESVCLREGELD